jgi:hypothetical protein
VGPAQLGDMYMCQKLEFTRNTWAKALDDSFGRDRMARARHDVEYYLNHRRICLHFGELVRAPLGSAPLSEGCRLLTLMEYG